MNWLIFALMLAGSFWEDKPPAQWTDPEISNFLSDSPWAQIVGAPARGMSAPPLQLFLSSAPTVAEAEKERARRAKLRLKSAELDTMAEELGVWMEENSTTHIVLTAKIAPNAGFASGADIRKLEEESYMQFGKTKVKMTGHFPPTKADPYLRMAFPRPEIGDEKNLTFSIYVPGLPIPFREVIFRLKDMVRNGKLEL